MNEPSRHDQDALDELLAEARWPEPAAESTRRLAAYYQGLRRRQLTWRTASIGLAAAAAVAVIAVISPRLMTSPQDSGQVTAKIPMNRQPVVLAPQPNISLPGREPTALELIVFRAHERRQSPTLAVRTHDLSAHIGQAVDRLARTPSADADTVARSLVPHDPAGEAEETLAAMLRDQRDERAVAIVRLLSEIGTSRSLPILQAAASRPAMRSAALPGLIRLADASTLGGLIRGEIDASTRERLLIALLMREPQSAMPLFLMVANDESSELRRAALAAFDQIGDPPLEQLWLAMDDPRIEYRLTAARVLGRAADPTTLGRLMILADRPERRREAIVALLASPHPLAQTALVRASSNSALAGLIRHLQQMEPVYVSYKPIAQPTL